VFDLFLSFVIYLPYVEFILWIFCLIDIQIVLFDNLIIRLFHDFSKTDLQTYTLFVIYIFYAV